MTMGVSMGGNGTDVDADGCSGSTPMNIGESMGGYVTGDDADDDADECSGSTPMFECGFNDPDEGSGIRSIFRSREARSEHVGINHGSSRGSSGSLCQPQFFQIHESVVEHCLTDSDSALECDEVATEGKRLGEQWPQRVEGPKRPRRPG